MKKMHNAVSVIRTSLSPIHQAIEFKILLLVCKALHGLEHISDLLIPYKPYRALRLSGGVLLSEVKLNMESSAFMLHNMNRLPESWRTVQLLQRLHPAWEPLSFKSPMCCYFLYLGFLVFSYFLPFKISALSVFEIKQISVILSCYKWQPLSLQACSKFRG